MSAANLTRLLRAVARRLLTDNQKRRIRRFLEQCLGQPLEQVSAENTLAPPVQPGAEVTVAIDGSAFEPQHRSIDVIGYPTVAPSSIIDEHKFAKIAAPGKLISVIYNYFEKESTVLRSIESLDKQNWQRCRREDIEIILIDDGSDANKIATQLPEDVIYTWQRKNRYGICRAKNTGARLANGDYLVFLDPDIMVGPGYFDSILNRFEEFSDRLVQSGYIWDYHFQGCPDPRTEFGVWVRPDRPTHRFYQIAGGNLAIARKLFFETPGFDEDLIYGGVEDLLFGYHLSKLPGTSVMFNRSMETWHIPHPPGGAHADPVKTWEIVKRKWPEFYRDYLEWGLR